MSVNDGGSPANRGPYNSITQYFQDPSLAARKLQNYTQFGSREGSAEYGAQLHPASDPNSVLQGYSIGSQDHSRIYYGMIADGTAIANCYRVQLGGEGQSSIIASAASHTSQSPFGATAINTYAPGTYVVVMVPTRGHVGVILGAVPPSIDVGRVAYHDYISAASRKRVDDCHKRYLKLPSAGYMVDYSAWKPVDNTLASEWGAVSSTGCGVSVDDFMVRASVSEFCGMYAFYHDQMLRLAGYNMQVWTAGSERDSYMDQAECNDTQGYTPYPWEGMGILQPGIPVIEQYDANTYNCFSGKPYYSRWENKHEFAQPYHRTQVFFGYLGQGHRKVVHAPPPGLQRWTYKGQPGGPGPTPYDSAAEAQGVPPSNCSGGADKLKSHEEKPVYGLHESDTALDGRLFIESAKGITISKRILIPIPQRIKRPEDVENGDEAKKNYKAGSKFGSGPEHDITGDFITTDNDYPNLQRAAAVLDLHGFLFNYAGLHPFYWHAKDYKTWEQQDLKSEGYADYNQKIPKFQELMSSKMYLKEEEPKKWKIDHRYDKKDLQKFWEVESYISLLEEGTVVIGDGYGGEIRMTGGCVFISAPGDVWLKGGRDVQAWAGSDIIARANNAVDISATEKNVRIKAERNVLVLAGNETSDREGGILLESRGKTIEYDFEQCGDDIKFAGVVLRAPESNVVGLAHQIYLRTGGGDIKPGDIVLDANKGDKDIITKSNNFFNYLKQDGRVFHFFGGGEVGGTDKTNMFSDSFTLLCGPLGLDKDIILDGNVLCRGSVLCTKGHILTEAAARGAIFVGPCDGDCQSQVNEGIEKIKSLIDDELPEIGNQIDEQKLKELWYKKMRAGDNDTIPKIEFSFRKDPDYKIPDFVLYEDRWQQMARISGQIPDRWTERPVNAKTCGPTWPFPGNQWLNGAPAYVEQDFSIVQYEGGYIDKQRGEAPGLAGEYREPKFKPNGKKVLNGLYPITPRK
jgi:hypothetical protein